MFSILFLVTNGSRELTEGWCWWYRQPRANKHTITQLSCSRPLSQRYIPWYAASRKLSHNVRAIDRGGKFEPPPPRGVEGFFAEILKSQILQKRPICLGSLLIVGMPNIFKYDLLREWTPAAINVRAQGNPAHCIRDRVTELWKRLKRMN